MSSEKPSMRERLQRILESKGHVKVELDTTYRGERLHQRNLIILSEGKLHLFELDPETDEPVKRLEMLPEPRMSVYCSFGWEIVE